MRITRIRMKNLFGVSELELDGRSVEVTGENGTGKTSIIHAIKYALTNQSDREYTIRQGASEGEIIIETDTGLYLNRKKREQQADYKSVKMGGKEVQGPEALLRSLFTPLQIDPVAFLAMDRREQNRAILDLIEFPWDLNWIKQEFGEIPEWPDYAQHILVVLEQIQAESGGYFQTRQDKNRDIRNQNAFIERIAASIPPKYDANKWEQYNLGEAYRQLEAIRAGNRKIEDAKAVRDAYNDRLRGLEAQRDIDVGKVDKAIQSARETISNDIARLEAELVAAKAKLATLGERRADKVKAIEAEHAERVAKLNASFNQASELADQEITDVSWLADEVNTAEQMKAHLIEYRRMEQMQHEVDRLSEESKALTVKIEHARELPGMILEQARIPVDGLTVQNGIPMIHGLPISNLSEGEKLELCVDVTLAKPNNLQIILIDGAEKLSDKNRERLYAKCKEHGIQFIATRTTNDAELEVHYL